MMRNYYKITNELECHHGMRCQTGMNIYPFPFKCEPDKRGGIYFAREHILEFAARGRWLRVVAVPPGAQVVEDHHHHPSRQWRADKLILGPRKRLTKALLAKLIAEGATLRERAVLNAIRVSDFRMVRWLVELGAPISDLSPDAAIMAQAVTLGCDFRLVRWLVKRGAPISEWCVVDAIKADEPGLARWLVKHGGPASPRVLLEAIKARQAKLTRWLMERGVHLNDDVLRQLIDDEE